MGRRALPKFDKTIDVSSHLLTFEQLPEVVSSASLFMRDDAPLEIEVGTGKGLFLREQAPANPDRTYLGVEVSRKYAHYVALKLLQDGTDNVKMLAGDALQLFREKVADNSVAAIHVYFPDPWWKARHRRRRVFNEPFINDVQRTLIPGGKLHFWTDVEEYYHSAVELIAEVSSLVGPGEVIEREPQSKMDYRTHFERRKRLLGKEIFRSEYVKK